MPCIRCNDKRSIEKDFLGLTPPDFVQLPILFRVSWIPLEARTVRKLIGEPRHNLYITSIYRDGKLLPLVL
jgi:hypothetical protein